MKNPLVRKTAFSYCLLVTVGSMVVLSGCERPEVERAEVVRPVRILTIGDGNVGRSLSYSGQMRAGETAELGFEVPGRIIELPVNEGQQVNQGDMLARLDPADFQRTVDTLLAGGSDPVITADPGEAAWTHAITDAALN